MTFYTIAWKREGRRRREISPYFLACGVGSTRRDTHLVNVGDREGEKHKLI